MMWPFKKKIRCCWYKSAGQPWPENIVEVIRFSPYKTDSIGYGIHECRVCGRRMFSCIGCHTMGPNMEAKIDAFIGHKITLDELVRDFEGRMTWWKIAAPTEPQNLERE